MVHGLLTEVASLVAEHRLWGYLWQVNELLSGMRDLSGPGLEPVSPALAGGFFTTEPPGKPLEPKFLTSFVNALSDSTIT